MLDDKRIATLLEPTLRGLGYELVDLELSRTGALIRIFIDRPGGVDVDACSSVSNHLSRLFAVEGVEYDRLEVSSPGLDRPLRGEADYRRFTGRLTKIVTDMPVEGQSHFAGRLSGVENGDVLVAEGRRIHRVPLARIRRARLDVEF